MKLDGNKQDQLTIVKIGGNVIDDEPTLNEFLTQFSKIEGQKILIHGGGKLATQLAERMGIPQRLIEGRRVTDAETLKIAVMVYGGWINKKLVSTLNTLGTRAIGVTGADGQLVESKKRPPEPIDYGFVGDVVRVNTTLLEDWLNAGLTPVIAPITSDASGQLLNTNADTMANAIATACARAFAETVSVTLVYSFEKKGVLLDVTDNSTLVSELTPLSYLAMKEKKQVFAGMLPKLDNAFLSIENGVENVILGQAKELNLLLCGKSGTKIHGNL